VIVRITGAGRVGSGFERKPTDRAAAGAMPKVLNKRDFLERVDFERSTGAGLSPQQHSADSDLSY
jgi:hypothetical protein